MSEIYVSSLQGDANLRDYYRFEGNANDSKGANNGSTTGAVSYGTSYGRFNQGILYPGGSGVYTTLSNTSYTQPTGAFTISAWIKGNGQTGNESYYFSSFHRGADGHRRGIWLAAAATAYASVGSDNATDGNFETETAHITGTVTTNNNAWHHIVTTWNGTNTLIVYTDGGDAQTDTQAITIGYTGAVCLIGAWGNDSDDNNVPDQFLTFNGSIDDLAIFDRALTAVEVKQLYLDTSGAVMFFP